MVRKPKYYRGGGGGQSHKRFAGTGVFGNYNKSSWQNEGRGENRRSGSWTDNSNNNIPPPGTQEEDQFQKFRDPRAQEKRGNNRRPGNDSQQGGGRMRNRNWRGGKQRYGNEGKRDGGNWYENRVGNSSVSNVQNQNEYPPATASPAPTIAPLDTSLPTEPPPIKVELPEETELVEKNLIKNIKQEKMEQKETKRITEPPPYSGSSSESPDSEDEPNNKPVQDIVESKPLKVDQDTPEKSTQQIATPQSSSGLSYSLKKTKATSNPTLEKSTKVKKKQTKKKQSSEEDLICLGKLEKKFVIEDDASEEADEPEQGKSATTKNQCLICDRQGHTAFECQMICKNCSAPYHNMKSCPKPVNLSIMMQSFMEFCMEQMSQFNPEQKFVLPTNTNVNKSTFVKENIKMTNEIQSKRVRKVRAKSKEPPKQLAKRNRKHTTKSSDESEDDEEEEEEEERKDESEEKQTSESESESDSSEVMAEPKTKKKRTKAPALIDSTDFRNAFMPPFSSFPAFGAAATAYNPLLFSQLMHSGGFGTPKNLNFK